MRPLILVAWLAAPTAAQPADAESPFELLAEEAQVVTAARAPVAESEAPASVYVLTAEDIRSSGAQTIWDALRALPGVDVTAFRTSHGEVAIRGLSRSLNHRALVLLDGRTLLNGYFDYVNWEAIPVSLDEIERIEVVEGPSSALYGPNALQGVVNIVTKSPERVSGTRVRASAGERGALEGAGLLGRRRGRLRYKLGLNWREFGRFSDADALASETGKLHALAGWEFEDGSSLTLSGGAANHNIQLATGGGAYDDGITSFLRADYARARSRLRVFWNWGRTELAPHQLRPRLDYDTYDLTAERAFELPAGHRLTAGVGFRRNVADSNLLGLETRTQDLYSLFFEDRWALRERWGLWLSGRLDRHPFTKWVFSPRGSVVYSPRLEHSFRLSAGQAFRNPTLLENYADFTTVSAAAVTRGLGVTGLDPERMFSVDLGHRAELGRLRASAVLFYWRLADVIRGRVEVDSPGPPVQARSVAFNSGRTEAVGGELGLAASLGRHWSAFANYTYQQLDDRLVEQAMALASPKHKVNWGLRGRRGGLSGGVWAHWVGRTLWPETVSQAPVTIAYNEAPAYLLVNARVAWNFSGALEGLSAAACAFNIADKEHFQAPVEEGAEVIRARWVLTLAYEF